MLPIFSRSTSMLPNPSPHAGSYSTTKGEHTHIGAAALVNNWMFWRIHNEKNSISSYDDWKTGPNFTRSRNAWPAWCGNDGQQYLALDNWAIYNS